MLTHEAYHFISSMQRVIATLVEKKNVLSVMTYKIHMNQLENCQARYRSNKWMGRTSHRWSRRVRAIEARLYY